MMTPLIQIHVSLKLFAVYRSFNQSDSLGFGCHHFRLELQASRVSRQRSEFFLQEPPGVRYPNFTPFYVKIEGIDSDSDLFSV